MHHPHKMNEVGSTPTVATNFHEMNKKRVCIYKQDAKFKIAILTFYLLGFGFIYSVLKLIYH